MVLITASIPMLRFLYYDQFLYYNSVISPLWNGYNLFKEVWKSIAFHIKEEKLALFLSTKRAKLLSKQCLFFQLVGKVFEEGFSNIWFTMLIYLVITSETFEGVLSW